MPRQDEAKWKALKRAFQREIAGTRRAMANTSTAIKLGLDYRETAFQDAIVIMEITADRLSRRRTGRRRQGER